MDVFDVERLLQEGKYNEVLQVVESLEVEERIVPLDLTPYQLLKCAALNKQGHFDEALQLAEHIRKESQENGEILHVVDACIVMAEALWRLERLEESTNVIALGEQALTSLVDPLPSMVAKREAALRFHHGTICDLKGEFDQALEHYQRSLILREQLGDKPDMAMSLNAIGLIYRQKGEL
ncbi:MAG: tetratricopeptide repeat protein [Candidatus Heimdallarchaeota archaeon]